MAAATGTSDSAGQRPFQFGLLHLLAFTTCVAVITATATSHPALGGLAAPLIIGPIVALFVEWSLSSALAGMLLAICYGMIYGAMATPVVWLVLVLALRIFPWEKPPDSDLFSWAFLMSSSFWSTIGGRCGGLASRDGKLE